LLLIQFAYLRVVEKDAIFQTAQTGQKLLKEQVFLMKKNEKGE